MGSIAGKRSVSSHGEKTGVCPSGEPVARLTGQQALFTGWNVGESGEPSRPNASKPHINLREEVNINGAAQCLQV